MHPTYRAPGEIASRARWLKLSDCSVHSRHTHNREHFDPIGTSGAMTTNALHPSPVRQGDRSEKDGMAISIKTGSDTLSLRKGADLPPLTQSHPGVDAARRCEPLSNESDDRQQAGHLPDSLTPAVRVLQHEAIAPTWLVQQHPRPAPLAPVLTSTATKPTQMDKRARLLMKDLYEDECNNRYYRHMCKARSNKTQRLSS